jgi:hypothetical protein
MHKKIPCFILKKKPLTNQNLHEKLAECFDEPAIGNGGHVVRAEGLGLV